MRDILRLYLTRNFVLAVIVGILLLALGRLPMLPVHNAFYAIASVSFAAFLMAIWAKPSNNSNALILPGVLRFSIPMAVTITGFGLAVYFTFLFCSGNGILDLGEDFYRMMYERHGSSWADFEGFWNHMSIAGESFEDVTARNALLIFLMLAGISQLFFIYPLSKYYSLDGEVSRDLKPTLLALLLFGLVALVYEIPVLAVRIASLALFPIEEYLLIMGFVALWFLFTVLFLKGRFMRKMSEATESAYKKSLEAEIEKEE
jgi:cation-transporting ATPase E